ncbi:MAG: 23S rRNA (pseudouridine(1915)-N(3))-methyltransferase RlmH [Fervidobacterium sp.]
MEIIIPGKLSKHLQPAFDYYLEKLDRFTKVHVSFVELGGDLNKEDEKVILKREAQQIEKRLKGRKYILIDLWGKQYTSTEFADFIKSSINFSSELIFVIGGPLGVDESLKQKAQLRISFSKMTFTHEMCLVLLLEQIFRSYKILNNERYHY